MLAIHNFREQKSLAKNAKIRSSLKFILIMLSTSTTTRSTVLLKCKTLNVNIIWHVWSSILALLSKHNNTIPWFSKKKTIDNVHTCINLTMLQVERGQGLINMNLLQVALNFISYFMEQEFQIYLPSNYQLIRLKNWKFTEYVSAKSALELRHCVQNREIFGVRIFIMVMFSIQKMWSK